MKKNQEQQTKERRSMKEVIIDNRGKIIAGVGVVSCVVSYVILRNKYENEMKNVTEKFGDKMLNKIDELNQYKNKVLMLEEDIVDLYEDNKTLSAILSEGVLQDAIETTSNKINSRTSKLRILEDRLTITPNDEEKFKLIEKIREELEVLTSRKDLYETKLKRYEIKDLVD